MSGIVIIGTNNESLSSLARELQRSISRQHFVTNTESVTFPTTFSQGWFPYSYIRAPRMTHGYVSRKIPYRFLPFKGTDFAPPPETGYFAQRDSAPQILFARRQQWPITLPRRECARSAFHYRPHRRRSH